MLANKKCLPQPCTRVCEKQTQNADIKAVGLWLQMKEGFCVTTDIFHSRALHYKHLFRL